MTGYPVPFWGWLLMIPMLFLCVAIAAGLFSLAIWVTRMFWRGGQKEESPLRELRNRYALGEITREQFEQMNRDLQR